MSALDATLRWYAERPARRVVLTVAVATVAVGAGSGLLTGGHRTTGGHLATVATASPSAQVTAVADDTATPEQVPATATASPSESPTVRDHEQEHAEPSPEAAEPDETVRRARAFVAAWLDTTGGHEAWLQRLCGSPTPLAAPDLCAGFAHTDSSTTPRITPAPQMHVEVLTVDGVSETVTVQVSPTLAVVVTSLRPTSAAGWAVTSIEPVTP